MHIPVIDLTDTDAAKHIDAACRELGFLAIVNHGVDTDVLRRSWDDARRLFDLPLAARMAVTMPRAGYPYGYSPLSGETLARSTGNEAPPDLKESFAIGPVDPPSHRFADADEEFAWSPNLWPADLPELRDSWSERYRELSALASRLLSVMAISLELSPDHFESMIDRHTSAMRAINYPGGGLPNGENEAGWGASAHTDYGTLTILEVDPLEPGLEVRSPDGTWLDVMPPAGALVVNLGDAMERWTNDRWRSTLHRVRIPTGRRQSIAFFHNANWDAWIECIPSCLDNGESARYAPIQAGPHLMAKFTSTVNRY